MRYEIVGNTGVAPKVAILVPTIQVKEIEKHYLPRLSTMNQNIMVCDLYIDPLKKNTAMVQIKEYLDDLLPNLKAAGITMLVVTNPLYFKALTKAAKTDTTIGDFSVSPYDSDFSITYCPIYTRVFYDPVKINDKIDLAMDAVVRWFNGNTIRTGSDIIKYAAYPGNNTEKAEWLQKLLDMNCDLTCDIETFSLKHYDAGLGTITFCWNEHEGIAFEIDNCQTKERNYPLRAILKRFFIKFRRKMIYHNICFDAYVLIYQLFMTDLLDQEGLLDGLDVMLRDADCSQIIAYLATNSCAGNELGLKALAQSFAGNYAVDDIHDITQIELPKLLKYNLIDGLSTWFVYKKFFPVMITDLQDLPYQTLFKPAITDIIQMQLTGMPINMEKVVLLDKQLNGESEDNLNKMLSLRLVQSFVSHLEDLMVDKKNAKLKTKQITKADLGLTKDTIVKFNPNSPNQLQVLLYEEDFLGLPVLDYTDTKQPATGAETLEKLIHHTKDPEVITFLEILIEFKASAIILSTFLPAFLKAQRGSDGWHYLFGNFRLGGTASGRLSSNSPNLQNIPSSGATKAKQRLAKLIKECFEAPPGWVFVGLDFDSLEDKISAVTTNDPEKIKVYSDGYDGHCLRALAYFSEHMPEIEICPETATAYKAEVDGKPVYFHSEEWIDFKGQKLLGSELFALLNQGAKNGSN